MSIFEHDAPEKSRSQHEFRYNDRASLEGDHSPRVILEILKIDDPSVNERRKVREEFLKVREERRVIQSCRNDVRIRLRERVQISGSLHSDVAWCR